MFNGALFQNSLYIAINIQNILYGIELFLYLNTIHTLTTRGGRKKSNILYALFSSMVMFVITVWVATQAMFGEEMWLLHPGYPGGANAYWTRNVEVWYMDWGMTSTIVLQLVTDAFMIYRCRIIWDSYRIVVIPVILWLTTAVFGVLTDWITSLPGNIFSTAIEPDVGLAYYGISVFLNTTLTCMIWYRIVRHAIKARECIDHGYAFLCCTVVTAIVESALPCTLSGIAFLVLLGLGSQMSIAFMCVYMLMMCISSQMLILRMVTGTAWDKDTLKRSVSTTIKV